MGAVLRNKANCAAIRYARDRGREESSRAGTTPVRVARARPKWMRWKARVLAMCETCCSSTFCATEPDSLGA